MHRETAGRNEIVLLAFLSGGLVGAMAALLAAPPPAGRRTRSRIAAQIRAGLRRSQHERARGGMKRRENAPAPGDGGVVPSAADGDVGPTSIR
jgi:hypothetical protein